jgi:hypothetical protein
MEHRSEKESWRKERETRTREEGPIDPFLVFSFDTRRLVVIFGKL